MIKELKYLHWLATGKRHQKGNNTGIDLKNKTIKTCEICMNTQTKTCTF